jgi:hypothetical protein
MIDSSTSNDKLGPKGEKVAEEVFSSEKREDIWAIIIALGIFIVSLVFPEQIHNFFRSGLYLF